MDRHFDLDKRQLIMKALNPIRLQQYKLNNYDVNLIVDYFLDRLNNEKRMGVFTNIIGMEFNVYWYEYMKNYSKSIEMEVDIKSTKIDVVADITTNLSILSLLPTLHETLKTLPKDINTFEAKAVHELKHDKVVKQIKNARGYYKHCHALVLADTKVSNKVNNSINAVGGDVLRSPITRDQLIQRINNLQQIIGGI